MPLKTLRRGLKKLRRHLTRKQEYGAIIKKDAVYEYQLFKLPAHDNEVIKNLSTKGRKTEIIEIRKIPQDFTEPPLTAGLGKRG